MHLPTLAAFRETLDAPDGRFRTLGTPVCERDARDELRFATGGSAVVFRAAIDGRRLALKGYLHPRPQAAELYAALERHPSPLRCPTRYLPEEIYLYITDCGAWYDLLVTEWADGHTLDYEIRRALHYRDAGRLAVLAAAFEAMAAELLAQPWAHGDLKPSNIVVAPDNTLRLIDYDGAFVPEREGLRAVETGTPACNHPLRGDRSGSMAEETSLDGLSMTRAEAVASLINQLLDELLGRLRRSDRVRDCLDLALLEYSGEGVLNLLDDGGGFVTVSELIRRPVTVRPRHVLRRLPSGNQVAATIPQRQWIEAKAIGNTPMKAAFEEAERLTRCWCAATRNRDSFPPIVINITDGEASDADDEELTLAAERLRAVATRNGALLLFNVHLASEEENPAETLRFPSEHDRLPDRPHARLLYDLSSTLPPCYDTAILAERPLARPPFRAVGYNCPINTLFAVLTVGTTGAAML